MTIRDLLRAHGTLDQYEILQRADALFVYDWVGYYRHSTQEGAIGRYYGGQLTDAEVETLTPKKEHHGSKAKARTDNASDTTGTARSGH